MRTVYQCIFSHVDITERAYLPFIPRLSEDSVLSGVVNRAPSFTIVTFPFGNTSFTKLYVSIAPLL